MVDVGSHGERRWSQVALGALSSVDATPAVDTVCEGIVRFAIEQLNRHWPRNDGKVPVIPFHFRNDLMGCKRL